MEPINELKTQSDSLRKELEDNRKAIVKIKTELDSLTTGIDFISEKSYRNGLKSSIQESTRQQQKGPLLKTFRIKTLAKKAK